jgi:DNA-binding MarR family transcriptional regulator
MAEDRDLVAGVIQLANLLNRRMVPVFEKARVTPQQWAVLVAIAGSAGPTTLAAVARRLAVSKQNMTGMVDRLQQLGVIERSDDPNDLRSSRIELTRRGRTLLEKLTPVYEQWRASLGEHVSQRDLRALTATINRLIAQLEQG